MIAEHTSAAIINTVLNDNVLIGLMLVLLLYNTIIATITHLILKIIEYIPLPLTSRVKAKLSSLHETHLLFTSLFAGEIINIVSLRGCAYSCEQK